MSKVFMNKRKSVSAIIAIVMTAVIIFGGTFAWQSISQEALNEVKATVNPGGRLHDDFVEITDESDAYSTITYNKDIYVENYTSRTNNGVQIFARVRLDEYMEFGENAGSDGSGAKPLMDGTLYSDRSTWTTLQWDQKNNVPVESAFSKYWEYSWGNDTEIDYMPTFNLDNTSLDPDVNGASYFDENGNRIEVAYQDFSSQVAALTDITSLEGTEVYADDADGNPVEIPNVVHTVEKTDTATVMSMEQWIAQGMPIGNFWVYDADGWAYYASPIDPDYATGLLLTGINRKENIINEDWYYAINVVAQFITKDSLGDGTPDNPGFNVNGEQPTANALQLLNKLGVDVTFEAGTADALQTALTHGGNIVLTEDITITAPLNVSANTTLDLNGHTINNTTTIWDKSEDVKNWSLISVKGADTTLTINGGDFEAMAGDCFAVDVRGGARVVINDGNFVGNISAVYVHEGTALINGGKFSIQQLADDVDNGYSQVINAYNDNRKENKATITICGGEFVGFNPTDADDGNLVAANYDTNPSTDSEGNTVYTVTKSGASASAAN